MRLGLYHHAFGGGSGAGRYQLALALDRDQADPTVPDDGKLGVPAEGGDVHPSGAGGLEDGGPGLEGDGGAVERKIRHEHQFGGRRG